MIKMIFIVIVVSGNVQRDFEGYLFKREIVFGTEYLTMLKEKSFLFKQ
jgi:hypothetical protein